jgi:hypothetical protein
LLTVKQLFIQKLNRITMERALLKTYIANFKKGYGSLDGIMDAVDAYTQALLQQDNVSRRFDDEIYESSLAAHLNDGINYGANTICKADQGDIKQLAADSFWYGYKAAVERFNGG